MDYLIIWNNENVTNSMCECVGAGITLCGNYCLDKCVTFCQFYCNNFCTIRYCDSSSKAVPWSGKDTM